MAAYSHELLMIYRCWNYLVGWIRFFFYYFPFKKTMKTKGKMKVERS